MNFLPVAKYLEQQDVGRQGKTIFVNHMPAQVPAGILLREGYGGAKIDHELPGYRRADFILVVRGTDYLACDALMTTAMTVLNLTEVTMDNMLFRHIRPEHEPVIYPLSVGSLYEFVVHFEAVYVIVSQS